ncbi:MAG TPA: class I SAM-dependent methyltransferase [Acidobacteriaceae bacterium]|jgi:cyclopropane-fatty-acyl-phospholipid synthase|nr:class I SAM-dependent methyltransferase [Acidobacteriaceae bacterium]
MKAATASTNHTRKAIFDQLFASYLGPAFAIQTWDGWLWNSSQNKSPDCTIVFRTPGALRHLFFDPNEWSLGQAFIDGDLDVQGDLVEAFHIAEHIFNQPVSFKNRQLQKIGAIFLGIQQRLNRGTEHSQSRDRRSIAFHYDQPAEFYLPWLGPSLVYSCAYFHHDHDCLDIAQENKMDHICRKLRLKPEERFLDIGCGWGSLILHAASRYQAIAHGITLSKMQAATAIERICHADLQNRCFVELRDYRALAGAREIFDKIASVGMFEHVGHKMLPLYFRIAHSALKRGGVFLNHGIARANSKQPRKLSFINRYVFPDGELVPISKTLQVAEQAGFEVRDVENLREHYAKTLRLWVKSLEEHAEATIHYAPKSIYRTWKLYMAGSAAAFERGDLGLYQILLSRPEHGKSYMPLTRADWYDALS